MIRAFDFVLTNLPAAFRYSLAVFGVLAAVGVRKTLNPLLGSNAPYLPFTLALVLIARYGGRGPALVSK